MSVRSWSAPHEDGLSVERTFDLPSYKIKIRYIIATRGVKTVYMAFDNQQYVREMQEFMSALPVTFLILDLSVYTELQKSVIEMLILSKNQFLLGDFDSSFLDLAFWFGRCF